MAANEDINVCYGVVDCHATCKLEPPIARLGNCLAANNNMEAICCLADNNVVVLLQLYQNKTESATGNDGVTSSKPEIELQRKLQVQDEELECHCMSTDEKIIGIAGRSVHLFTSLLNCINGEEINLSYVPKSIAITCLDKVYNMAIAGSNGVDIYVLNFTNHKLVTRSVINLHTGLAIAVVEYSRGGHYLAVATMDGHLGIWRNSTQDTFNTSKDFWYAQLKSIRITSLKFSPEQNMVAVGCWDQNVYLYQLVCH
ncbi:hypothetical protein TrispH2_003299 [Trichoplax sp. H2]|nr:hypothetical protein TrispH2_003299 [Trichoplax sp. H2]|eukprot:RDD44272.1 hypothetical protein TrispH2_003299 [Trichoplax sp. H2]